MFPITRTTVLTAMLAAGLGLLASAPAQADVLAVDRTRCGSALVTAKLEASGRQYEVDVEVYSGPRERWTITTRTPSGAVLNRIVRTTNREGEFDAWRYLQGRPNVVDVVAQGPAGRCIIRLQA